MAPPWPPGQGSDNDPGPTFRANVDGGPPTNNLWGGGNEADWFTPDWQPTTQKFEELSRYVMNQKPAHVHALGDMFVRAAQLLRELETNVRTHSTKLFSEDWTKAEARDAFMVKGPGRLLAYIRDWATQQAWNIDAMYDLVEPIQTSQTEMQKLIDRYDADVKAAGTATVSDNIALGRQVEYGGSVTEAQRQLDETLLARETAKREEFDRLARDIVRTLSGAYKNEFNKMLGGIGRPYSPPNVIMATPGVQWPDIPAVGAPNVAGFGGGAPNVRTPPTGAGANAPNVQRLANGVPDVAQPPALREVPTARTVTNVPTGPQVTTPNVGAPPGAPALPPMPPGLGVGARSVPNGLTAPNISGVPGGGTIGARSLPTGLTAPNVSAVPGVGGGVTGPGAAPGVLPPPGVGRGISRGVLGRQGQTPGVLPPPGAGLGRRGSTFGRQPTVRNPAANYTGTGAGGIGARGAVGQAPGVLPPPGVNTGRRQGPGMPVTRGGAAGVPAAFSQSSMPPPVAPVLGRQNRRGPGEHGAYNGPQIGDRGAFAPPSATPPVLNAQSRTAGALPPPAGIPPLRRQRRRADGGGGLGLPGGLGAPGGGLVPPGGFAAGRRDAGRYTGQPAPHLVGNPDWLAETTRDSVPSTAPVLRNHTPTAEPAGAMPPMMPSMPGANAPVIRQAPGAQPAPARGTARTQGARGTARPAQGRPGPSEAELARRSREDRQQEARPGEEEAFTMQTPGGPVVGSTPARPEEAPKPTVGNT